MSLGGARGKARDASKVAARYELYGMRLSFFTCKVRAAMHWYFPGEFAMVDKTPQNKDMIEKRSGTHQIPVLITPENWCIADSTPLFRLLDSRLPEPRLYPCDPFTACVCALIEEYFDEWMARLTIHTRWYYDESAVFAATEMMRIQGVPEDKLEELVKSPASPINWGRRAIRALGMNTETQRAQGEAELLRLHTALDKHLADRSFVLGDAPTAVDAVLMGGLQAHFFMDPWPKKFLSHLDNVRQYAARWQSPVPASARATPLDPDNLPPFIHLVLTEMGASYRNFVVGNGEALASSSKAFVANVYDEDVSYLARPYVEKSRRMLSATTAKALGGHPTERKAYVALLKRYRLDDVYGWGHTEKPLLGSSL